MGYFDSYGILHGAPHSISQNGALFTAHHAMLTQTTGIGEVVLHVLVERGGRTIRHPTRRDEIDSTDNLVGLGTLAALCTPYYAKEILDYGRKNGFKAFLFRMLQVKAHLKLAAGFTPNPIERLVWTYCVISSTFKKSHDDFLLTAHLVFVGKRYGGTIEKCVAAIHGLLEKRKFSQVLRDYLTDKEHPLIRFAERVEVK